MNKKTREGKAYLQDGLVDGSQGARARSGTGVLQSSVEVLSEDSALADEDNVLATELLLQLTDESGVDLVGVLEEGEGDEDDDSLLAAIDVDLLSTGDLQVLQVGLEVGSSVL